jgi:hypothetical protein
MLQSVTDIAGRRVVSLTETSGKDQDFLHQSGKNLRTRLRSRAGICLDTE